MRSVSSTVATIALVAGVIGQCDGAAAQSPLVITQTPCTGSAFCLVIDKSNPSPISVRTIDAVAPITGRAVITFHGSLVCFSSVGETEPITLESQIVTFRSNNPDYTAASGLLLTGYTNPVANFNLASTRVVSVEAGQRIRFAFRMDRIVMGGNVICRAHANNAFTIEFVQ